MNKSQADKYFFFRKTDNFSNRTTDKHYHSGYEIYFLTDGKCCRFVGDRFYDMCPGDVLIIPPGLTHGMYHSTKKHGRILINFTEHFVIDDLVRVIQSAPIFCSLGNTKDEVLCIFDKIGIEDISAGSFSDEAKCALLSQLVILILRQSEKNSSGVAENDFVAKAIQYVRNNYRESMLLEDIAKECNVSRVHLSRKFKKNVGVGISKYICDYRMEKAKELLLTQEKIRISEIAVSCGFNDSNYFSSQFKKICGVTPTQYRKDAKYEYDNNNK